jgi:hypothetical protein
VGLQSWAKARQKGENPRINTTSKAFQDTLYAWEGRDWIKRTPTHVEVIDRAALQAHLAELGVDEPPKRTIAEIEREIAERRQASNA